MNPQSNSSKIVLILLELIIPLIGFLFWNWGFVFIMLFFALDWFVLLLFQFVKMRQYLKLGLNPTEKRFLFTISSVLLCTFLSTLSIAMVICYISVPNFNLTQEIIRFLTYEDTGIQQGYLLIPICFLNGYMIYQRDFSKPKTHHIKTVKEVFAPSVTIHIVTMMFSSIVGALTYFLQLNGEVLLYIALASILLGKVYFQIIKSNA